ncbi:type IV pilus assembly protein PilW [Pseudomonas benzenivorans]|nr:type IV pilus assembly protein PilW [Pseudomonas benzenivorans]
MQGLMRNQAGFSLIELLVSLAISVLIMTATLQLFLDITRTNDEMAKTNAQIENGRFAIQLLQGEIAHAGFWGGYVPQFDDLTASDTVGGSPALVLGTPRISPNPCNQDPSVWSSDDKDALVGVPVQVFGAALAGCSMPDKVAGTDVLVVRHAALAPLLESAIDDACDDDADPATPAPVCVQNTFCADEMPGFRLDTGTVNTMHFKDCVTPTNSSTAAFPQTGVRQYVSNIYYIKDVAGVPTLMRLEYGATGAQPLIEGVEGFRVELGLDNVSKTGAAVDYSEVIDFGADDDRTNPLNRGDGVPDVFVRCPSGGCSVDQLRDVVAVKLYVLVRNLQETTGYEDDKEYCLESPEVDAGADCSADALFQPDADEKKYKRHLFSTTIRLVNVSGRRETP